VAKKSPLICQMLADTIGLPIRIHRSEQTCALGAAMFAATVAGIHPNVEKAMAAMGPGFEKTYEPRQDLQQHYQKRYDRYKELGKLFSKS
jgi:L-ribulokinase